MVRSTIEAIIELDGLVWGVWLVCLLLYTVRSSLPAFNMMLDRVPPPDEPADRKHWLRWILDDAQRYACFAHIESLLRRGYLDETRDFSVMEPLLEFAFEAGTLGLVWRVLKHAELEPSMHWALLRGTAPLRPSASSYPQ